MALLSLDQIEELTEAALRRCGATALQAGATARSVRDAEAEGIRNVGLGYLPLYCSHLLCGKVVGTAVPAVAAPDGATLRADANLGFAHPAFESALDPFAGLVSRHGIALLTITRSYSAGVLGWMVDLIARRGLVALAFANSSPLVAPWGGRVPRLGTNPFAYAVPRSNDDPLVFDMATSATAYVNILEAANDNRPIPLGWALDADGTPTDDPHRALAGTVAPLGGAKGFGLGLLVEIFGAGLSGSNWGIDSSSFGDDEGGPPGVGQSFVAIDPNRSSQRFSERLERLLGVLHSDAGVRLPGERRHASRRAAETNGVDVPDALLTQINALGHDGS
ncbi:MAG TPA: Ldh family oxidoreductase [Ilumatobacteraceae bacterium]